MSFSEKVQGRHQDRLALVYVRQSTLRQVEKNQESTRLQYALVERALQLGWARQRVEVIDDDLGRSGATTANRPGFQRLMTEVGLGHVGLVLGVEMSLAGGIIEVAWYTVVSFALSSGPMRTGYLSVRGRVDRVLGTLLIALGLKVALDAR